MIKRLKSFRPRRRLSYSRDLSKVKRRSLRFGALARRRRQRRWFGVLAVLLASLATAIYALTYASGGEWGLFNLFEGGSSREAAVDSESTPEQTDTTPAGAAYRTVASEYPKIDSKSVEGVYQSKLDPSWASVRITVPDEDTYIIFLQRGDDNLWKARKSIRADEPEHPENEKVVLDDVPKDLVDSIYPPDSASEASGLIAEPVDPGSLPTVKPAEVPPPDPVTDNVPESERERVDKGLKGVQQAIEEYDEGVTGVYVQDLNGGYGYGVRPDEIFFSASIAKVPVMVAVFRRIDEGELSLDDSFETKAEDWAAGAGWMQWDPAGRSHTVKDYLLMMMTQSDNVATNAMTRLVGGPEYVNQVTRSMGATNTVLYQKVTSERAAVTSLDNRTTPRDLATILAKISTREAASPESCREMIDIMHQNHLESGLKEALPEGTEAAAKGGWLYRVYDEVAIVGHEDRPYAVAIFNKHGPENPKEGKPLLKDISEAVWKTQDNDL